MSNYKEPTPEDQTRWKDWVEARPENVRVWAEKFYPWVLYRMKSSAPSDPPFLR